MSDKVSMSLDDIIKMQKKTVKSENNKAGPKKNNNNRANANGKGNNNKRGKVPVRNARVAAAARSVRGARAVNARAATRAVGRKNIAGLRSVGTAGGNNATINQATKKLVAKLVKNALRKSNVAATPIVRRRGGVAASTLETRRNARVLNRVLPQSRTIVRRPPIARPARQQAQRVIEVQRPAPVRQVVRRVITAPPAPIRQVVRRPPPARTVLVQRVASQPRRQFFSQEPRRVEVQMQRVRQQPIQRRPQRQYERVVERVVERRVPQGQFRREIVTKNNRFRGAMGMGNGRQNNNNNNRRTVVRQVERFQPVQYVTEQVVRRGRGFTY